MRVIGIMGNIAYMLYGALGFCLVMAVGFGLKTGRWDIAIITALVGAVSTGAGSAAGFIGGVLSQAFGNRNPNTRASDDTLPADIGREIVAASEQKPIQTQDAGETNDNAN